MGEINISSKEDLIDFLNDSWIVPPNSKLNETVVAKLYNEDSIIWEGEGDFPLASMQWSKTRWHLYQISLSSVMYIPGASQPTAMGTFNNILTSNSTNNTSSFRWNTSFDTEGTYSLNLILNFKDGSTYTIERSIVVTKDIIARATTTVSNGRGETSSLIYSQGKSRSDLIPGHNYQINGMYQENDHYKYGEGIGTLEMLKCSTTTTLSGNSQITYGENISLNITVKENINNSSISRGTLKLYDGNELVQTTTITNQNTSISYTPSTTGIHDLYIIYEDSGVEYNTSTSNHLSLTVAKIQTHISLKNTDMAENGIVGYIGDSFTIPFSLLDENENELENESVTLYDYNGSVLDTISTSSSSECTYSLSDEFANYQTIHLEYEGTNEYDSCILEIPITILQQKALAYVSLAQENYIVNVEENYSVEIEAQLKTVEDDTPLVGGEVSWYIIENGVKTQIDLTSTVEDGMTSIMVQYDGTNNTITVCAEYNNNLEEYENDTSTEAICVVSFMELYIYDSTENQESWINISDYSEYEIWSG